MKVTMRKVESSNIWAVGYDPENQQLHITFRSGKKYIYRNVSQAIFDELLTTGLEGSTSNLSVGQYVNRQIVGKHPFNMVRK